VLPADIGGPGDFQNPASDKILGFRALPQATFAEVSTATVTMNGYTPIFRAFVEQQAQGH